MKKNYCVLAIDTSCDETSAAVTINDAVVSNVLFSQVKIHSEWGGVVPMLAKRAHEERIEAIVNQAVKQANINSKRTVLSSFKGLSLKDSIDAIAVTVGPGLAPALEVGVRYAKELAIAYNKPLIAVNHMEGHLLSPFAKNAKGKGSKIDSRFRGNDRETFPLLGLLVSGKHTQLVLVKSIGDYLTIGETLDDAIGEAFDKVGRMLDLGYPGGPIIERLAKVGNEYAYNLPIPMKGRKDLSFSYSGLKTAVRYLVEGLKVETRHASSLQRQTICDVSASFQRVATASLIDRLERAILLYKPNGLLLGGGVISNVYIRRSVRLSMKPYRIPVYIPFSKKLFTDNAGMIGVVAFHKAKRNEFVTDIASVERIPNLNFPVARI